MTNLNLDTSPYFDDFDASKDYHRVLFKPGFPVQARELTTLQTILQNQVKNFGNGFYQEGAVVVPGGFTYNSRYTSVQVNPQQGGVNLLSYIDGSIGKNIFGAITRITARIVGYSIPPDDGVENITLYVSYINSGLDNEELFLENEPLLLSEPLQVASGATIPENGTLATTIELNPSAIGCAFSIDDGIYFIKGAFVQIKSESIVVDPFSNTGSFRLGLRISENIVTAFEDNSLYDNAKGFNNFTAPGADRYQIETSLAKKSLDDDSTDNFIELLRVINGIPQTLDQNNDNSDLLDLLARRTFDESGSYSVSGFGIDFDECLNDLTGNGGVYLPNQITADGNVPSDDLVCMEVDPGVAYVKGYEVRKTASTVIDVEKARDTTDNPILTIPFELGTKFVVNNVSGTPLVDLDRNNNIIELYNSRSDDPTATKIGEGRTYQISLEDAPYVNNASIWNLYLYDVQFYTEVTISGSVASNPADWFIRGQTSNSTAFVESGSGTNLLLTQVSGNFIPGESISINGRLNTEFSIVSTTRYSASDVVSVFQDTTPLDANILSQFNADLVLAPFVQTNFSASDNYTIDAAGNVTCAGRLFNNFRVGNHVIYQREGLDVVTINVVTSVASDVRSMVIEPIASVSDVCDGALPPTTINTSTFRVARAQILNVPFSSLYSRIGQSNISNVALAESSLIFSSQLTNEQSVAGILVVASSQIGVPGAVLMPFDQERYSIIYSDGVVESISSSQVTLQSGTMIFTGLSRQNESNITVNITSIKPSVTSKKKILSRSNIRDVELTSDPNNTANGLALNDYYGLRVEDREISLNVPDVFSVLCVYEAIGNAPVTFDQAVFPAQSNLDLNTIIGENMVGDLSGAVARVVSSTTSTISFIYLSRKEFIPGEEVYFGESAFRAIIQGVNPGRYSNIGPRYNLDDGQRNEFYDYSRIIRENGSAPKKALKIVYDRLVVPANDTGDFYTVNSYTENTFADAVGILPVSDTTRVRASDTLDFRPRVADFNSTTTSPFSFNSRQFENSGSTSSLVPTANEGIVISYSYYLPRIDILSLSKAGQLIRTKGVSAVNPVAPATPIDTMLMASIIMPAYTYNIKDIGIILIDNRRYTMRDIGALDERLSSLEETTTLNLLEASTQSIQVLDSDGNNRFKSGFFADNFKTSNFVDTDSSETKLQFQSANINSLVPQTAVNTVPLRPVYDGSVNASITDLSQNPPLLDPNTRQTGNYITLDYVETPWLKQSQVSFDINVNPYEVVIFQGILNITPNNFNFVSETYELIIQVNEIFRDVVVADTVAVPPWRRQQFLLDNPGTQVGTTGTPQTNRVIENGASIDVLEREAAFVNERNLIFYSKYLRPHTEVFNFIDGSVGIDLFPKLVEIEMVSGVFEIGETVFQEQNSAPAAPILNRTTVDGTTTTTRTVRNSDVTINDFTARVASQNHKEGAFNNPSVVYTKNPYDRLQTLPGVYSASSTLLNIDLNGLLQDGFGGKLIPGLEIRGRNSGAVARIKPLRLVTDVSGDVQGAYYVDSPFEENQAYRLRTGTRTFRLSSDRNNSPDIELGNIYSFAETNLVSSGVIRNVTETRVTNIVNERITRTVQFTDPLAQTFLVDGTGAVLTSLDVFFSTKSNSGINVTVEIRPTNLGIPESYPLNNARATITPDDITVSDNGSIATNIKFPTPVYLEANTIYAFVLLAPNTSEYKVWAAKMLETDLLTGSLITKQYLNGTLFKSQNGATWTADQTADLTFTLYKAQFTASLGRAVMEGKPTRNNVINGINPIQTYPRKLATKINNSTLIYNEGDIVATSSARGAIESLAGQVSSSVIASGGSNFKDGTYTDVNAYSINTLGLDLSLDVTISDGVVSSIVVNNPGSGYKLGDSVGVTTSQVDGIGGDCIITINELANTDTLYLTDVSGDFMRDAEAINIVTGITSAPNGDVVIGTSNLYDQLYSGSVFSVEQFNHGMQSDLNYADIRNVLPSGDFSLLTQEITISSNVVTVDDSSEFETFEGLPTTTGYLIVDREIIAYSVNIDGTLGILERGVDGSNQVSHRIGAIVRKYEINGVSLRRVCTTSQLANDDLLGNLRTFDRYYVSIDRSDRSTGSDILNFNVEGGVGGGSVTSSRNLQYSEIFPNITLGTPINTAVNLSKNTISGTSVDGDEESYVNLGVAPIQNESFNLFNQPLLAPSQTNIINNPLVANSLLLNVDMATTDPNLSPYIDITTSNATLIRNRLNSPINNYADDQRVKELIGDPHSFVYISEGVDLKNPATSLKLILGAVIPDNADMRVLYRIFGADSVGATVPSWELFPGYTNLIDVTGDGFGDVIVDTSKNNGLPNQRVLSSVGRQTQEYQYQIDSLPEFSRFEIKIVFSSTNEASYPELTEIRAIALA